MLQLRASTTPFVALALLVPLAIGCGGGGNPGTGGNGNGGSGGSGGSAGGGGGTGGGGGGGMDPAPAHGFGTHPMPYPGDVLKPTGDQKSLDNAVAQAYDQWKAKYVKQGCGGYYVLSGGGTGTDVGDEVSEGQGYGMVITAIMAGHDPEAKTVFDGLYAFFKKFPSDTHKNLMAWTVNVAGGCVVPPMAGADSATDGDLDIGFALLLADKQWPGSGYADKAAQVIGDIKRGDIHGTTFEPVLGDWATSDDPQYNSTRPSDFMLDHFRAFAATGDPSWMQTIDAVYGLVDTMQKMYAPQTGLLPDFVVNTTTTPAPAMAKAFEGPDDGHYDYNSCRVPWRIATDYIVSHDMRAKTAAAKWTAWIKTHTGGDPSKIMDGYTLDGMKDTGQTGTSSAFSSPFGVSAMLGSDQAWLDKIWTTRAVNEDYFGDSITMLSMIVMSGNWWSP
jgi:endo-1,4-beta-D-glucanase Y